MRRSAEVRSQIRDRLARLVEIHRNAGRVFYKDLQKSFTRAFPPNWGRNPYLKKIWQEESRVALKPFKPKPPPYKPRTIRRRKPKPITVAPGQLEIDV
ncbi:MAG: hypothetical protein AAGA60_09450 [Cyanobacteria bacterium P01_E01_bin.42]